MEPLATSNIFHPSGHIEHHLLMEGPLRKKCDLQNTATDCVQAGRDQADSILVSRRTT
jgi:hypothetical protein